MNRREFLRATSYASVALLAPAVPRHSADAEITLTVAAGALTISPHLYGQFIEHLGGVIYDGIWVGSRSQVTNIGGIRKQFVDDLKAIGVPNFRWPGGCFADGYHWRDGLGPAAKRPRTYNYWQATTPTGVDATETNQFGVHECMRLCRLTGAEPYLAAKIGLTIGSLIEARGTQLTHSNMAATNTFDHPAEVGPAPLAVSVRAGRVELTLSPRSVVSLELRFA